jgi:hypothetical protein
MTLLRFKQRFLVGFFRDITNRKIVEFQIAKQEEVTETLD